MGFKKYWLMSGVVLGTLVWIEGNAQNNSWQPFQPKKRNISATLVTATATPTATPTNTPTPTPTPIPVAFDVAAVGIATDGLLVNTGITIANNANRVLFALIATSLSDSSSSGPAISSVTIDGLFNMSLVGLYTYYGPLAADISIYQYINPPAGAHTVVTTVMDFSNIIAGAVSLYNVNQTTPTGSLQTASGTSTAPSKAVAATATSSLVINMAAYATGSAPTGNLTVNAQQTQMFNTTAGADPNGAGAGAGRTTGGGTVTPSWTLNGAFNWGVVAVEVKVP